MATARKSHLKNATVLLFAMPCTGLVWKWRHHTNCKLARRRAHAKTFETVLKYTELFSLSAKGWCQHLLINTVLCRSFPPNAEGCRQYFARFFQMPKDTANIHSWLHLLYISTHPWWIPLGNGPAGSPYKFGCHADSPEEQIHWRIWSAGTYLLGQVVCPRLSGLHKQSTSP